MSELWLHRLRSLRVHVNTLLFLMVMWGMLWPVAASATEPAPSVLWSTTFDSGGHDEIRGGTVGPDGNPVVSGPSTAPSPGLWRTIKYHGITGAVIWNATFAPGQPELAIDVAVGPDGNPVVAGNIGYPTYGLRTIKYDGATGAVLWNVTFHGPTRLGAGVGIGPDGHPVVAGHRVVIKYDGSTGAVLWTNALPGDASPAAQDVDAC